MRRPLSAYARALLMRPRFGAALSATVLRPLAEQLVQEIDLHPGAVVCELMCDGGTLTPFLARAVAPIGVVVTIDTDLELATQAAENVLHISKVVPRMGDGATVALDDESCDAVASLLTVVFADHRFLLEDARRVLRPDGSGAVVVWDPERPPAFVATLLDALRAEGIASPFLERMLAPVAVPRGATARGLRDVCRVETATHLWAAMLDGPLAVEVAALTAETVAAVRARYEASLQEYEEPDGTMRIPLHARVITLRGGAPRRRDGHWPSSLAAFECCSSPTTPVSSHPHEPANDVYNRARACCPTRSGHRRHVTAMALVPGDFSRRRAAR